MQPILPRCSRGNKAFEAFIKNKGEFAKGAVRLKLHNPGGCSNSFTHTLSSKSK
jgi:hypothetical protein